MQIDMPLPEAKSLLSRAIRKQTANTHPRKGGSTIHSPRFYVLPHDPIADLHTIEKLADDLDSFSPIIGLQQETEHPDCIFLDVTGLAPLFGSELELAKGVFDFCEQQGYLVHVAIADTIAMAQGTAQFKCGTSSSHFQIARDQETLHELPIPTLRLDSWITTTLHQLGITTIGQLLKLPRKDLSARFGPEIYKRVDQMTGKTPEPIIARHPQPEFYAEQLIEHPTSHLETIEVILERLIEKICAEMSSAQQGALQWTIRMYSQDQKLPLKLYVSLFQPTATADHVLQLAKMQLENVQQERLHSKPKRKRSAKSRTSFFTEPVQEITISVTSCVLLTQRQRQLFDENPRLDRQELSHLINRLSSRLGRQNVVYPTLASGAQPEHAFRMKPLVNPYSRGPRRTVNAKRTHTSSHVMARPIKTLQPPIALENVSSSQNNEVEPQRPPAPLIFAGQQHNVINQWGPERIETGWWRGATARRDYWRVETDSHQQFWIYRDLRKRAWFLQGEF